MEAYGLGQRLNIPTDEAQVILDAYFEAFPNVKVVVDAPVQMEREVAGLRQAAGATSGRDLEAMLAALAASLPPQRAIGALDYANGELRVRGLALAAEDVRNVAAAMKARGYNAALSGDVLVVTAEDGA